MRAQKKGRSAKRYSIMDDRIGGPMVQVPVVRALWAIFPAQDCAACVAHIRHLARRRSFDGFDSLAAQSCPIRDRPAQLDHLGRVAAMEGAGLTEHARSRQRFAARCFCRLASGIVRCSLLASGTLLPFRVRAPQRGHDCAGAGSCANPASVPRGSDHRLTRILPPSPGNGRSSRRSLDLLSEHARVRP